jgi:hypothetical protein
MDERAIRVLDDRLRAVVDGLDPARYLRKLTDLLYYDDREPYDASIIPLVITADRHAAYQRAAQRICAAALADVADRRARGGPAADAFERLLLDLPLRHDVVSGNARFDFLEEGDRLRLVEMNFVGVGTTGHSHQPAVALLECLPTLREHYTCLHPVDAFREQLVRHDVRTLALITKDNDREFYGSWLDRLIIVDRLRPVNTLIVPRADWPAFRSDGRSLCLHGTRIDAVYPRELTWRRSIEEGRAWCRFFADSGARCLDHWSLILAEDKNLPFLLAHDPGVAEYLPRSWTPGEHPPEVSLADCVIKRRHEHAGDGVEIAPERLPEDDGLTIVQERVRTNRTFVRSVFGFEGVVTYDVAAHVSFDYDLRARRLLSCVVSGYLSRYAPAGDIVNISRGGGVLPVLLERSGAPQDPA